MAYQTTYHVVQWAIIRAQWSHSRKCLVAEVIEFALVAEYRGVIY
jgi:hypothetical protein